MPWKFPATIAVFPAYKFQKFEQNVKKINGHADMITHTEWSPFNPQHLMSSSKDATIKLWEIPTAEGLTHDMGKDDAIAVLEGHQRDC